MIEYSIHDEARILAEGDILELIHRTLRYECFDEFCANIAGREFSRVRVAEDAAQRMAALADVIERIRLMGIVAMKGKEHGEG